MLDNKAIYVRFAACYDAETPSALARILGITRQTVVQWAAGVRPVPWLRLLAVVRQKGISWDWLLAGTGQKELPPESRRPLLDEESFDIIGINTRFLTLFPRDLSQAELGKMLGVSQATISKWRTADMAVSWEMLEMAVDRYGATWHWLLDGAQESDGDAHADTISNDTIKEFFFLTAWVGMPVQRALGELHLSPEKIKAWAKKYHKENKIIEDTLPDNGEKFKLTQQEFWGPGLVSNGKAGLRDPRTGRKT